MLGWISIYRELLEKPIWTTSTPEQKTILITIMLMVNHEPNEWEFKGEKFTVKKGQMITSLDSIVAKCGKGVTIQNVRTALKRFEKYGFLTSEPTNKNRLITLVNWEVYQQTISEANKQTNKQLTSNQQATNKQLTTNNNVNNDKNDKKKEYDTHVKLTETEFNNLIEKFGQESTNERIERLSLYKGSTGKKYKSDYMTILNWAKKEDTKINIGSHNKNNGVDWDNV